jgi:hypothetical protein
MDKKTAETAQNQALERMTRSAVTPLFQVERFCALLVIARLCVRPETTAHDFSNVIVLSQLCRSPAGARPRRSQWPHDRHKRVRCVPLGQ